MIFNISDLKVYFPYDYIYPEQYKYISEFKSLLDSSGHGLIEMGCGTGKTLSVLSVVVSYILKMKKNENGNKNIRLIYCSRTVGEIEKVLDELKNIVKYIGKYDETVNELLGVGLASRKNLCINKEVINSGNVEIECRKRIMEWSKIRCDFFDALENNFNSSENHIKNIKGIYNLDEMREYGIKNGVCPYYLVREILTECDIIVYTYNYLIDPHINDVVSKELIKEDTIVVFDEAHNIDNSCIESMSIEVKRSTLDLCTKLLKRMEDKLHSIKDAKQEERMIMQKRKNKYEQVNKTNRKLDSNGENKINTGLRITKINRKEISNCISNDQENIPGTIRNSFHFISMLKRIVEFFKAKLRTTHLTSESTLSFCRSIKDMTYIDRRSMSCTSQRLCVLISYLNLYLDEEVLALKTVSDFITLCSMHKQGFTVLFEPFDTMAQTVFNPYLRLWCLDASIAMKKIFDTAKNVIITSGTLSPPEMYTKILNFTPVKILEIGVTLDRNSITPMVITKGNDQMTLKPISDDLEFIDMGRKRTNKIDKENTITTSFSLRSDPAVVRNYAVLILEFSKIVPDGMIVFFPSYIYMEEIVSIWSETRMIDKLMKHKLVFIETPNYHESELAIKNYRKAIDEGKGAIMFCVARGKVSEGVDFEYGYGRCVIVMGVPYQFTESVRLKHRLSYMRKEYGIKENDFLTFDAIRHTAQCLGRVMRNKKDYGLMVMADHRFDQKDKKEKLPRWVLNCLDDANSNLSIDMATQIAKRFYKDMGQPVRGEGHSLLSQNDLEEMEKKVNKE
ncbi:DNA repair helicase rad3 [Spraguea lophii 42_110]|uniref:DNA 5'-3' helicase n=1 Tax=Spraguea lophii (strain 42_110) TaxID=1358809 RepID=S7XGV2_SPRLO|nr:DNA repair helicase rad3 [Spraguea lophii 42_110]